LPPLVLMMTMIEDPSVTAVELKEPPTTVPVTWMAPAELRPLSVMLSVSLELLPVIVMRFPDWVTVATGTVRSSSTSMRGMNLFFLVERRGSRLMTNLQRGKSTTRPPTLGGPDFRSPRDQGRPDQCP